MGDRKPVPAPLASRGDMKDWLPAVLPEPGLGARMPIPQEKGEKRRTIVVPGADFPKHSNENRTSRGSHAVDK